jgi:predicted DNA-binding transcriptional regulator AlpA
VTALDLRALVEATAFDDLPALGGRLREAELLAEARLRAVAPPPTSSAMDADTNISVKDAAHRLGVSPSYIYKNAKSLPFLVRIGRRLVCSPNRLERWRRTRQALDL